MKNSKKEVKGIEPPGVLLSSSPDIKLLQNCGLGGRLNIYYSDCISLLIHYNGMVIMLKESEIYPC
jgi:hypothetical protein